MFYDTKKLGIHNKFAGMHLYIFYMICCTLPHVMDVMDTEVLK